MKRIAIMALGLLTGLAALSWAVESPPAAGQESMELTQLAEDVRADWLAMSDAMKYSSYLPIVVGAGAAPLYDMAEYMVSDPVLYEVRHSNGSQARHQTQTADTRFFHTKGNELAAEWEELWATDDTIYRGTDTSPGNGQYYTLFEDNVVGSKWSPRQWRVGDLYERNPFVVFYRKDTCQIVASGFQRSWLRFDAFHPTYEFTTGIELKNVIELAWLLEPDGSPIESYFYAEGYGLVGWASNDRGKSHISEIHASGARPDNKRETITCLSPTLDLLENLTDLNYGPLPDGFRAK